jgi:hypothetical protein
LDAAILPFVREDHHVTQKASVMTADGRQLHVLIINDTQEILDLLSVAVLAKASMWSTWTRTAS